MNHTARLFLPSARSGGWRRLVSVAGGLWLALLLAGCVAPIGTERVTTREAYSQVAANALRSGKPSAETISLLHRFSLTELAVRHPDEAVRQLHEKAVATGERNLLFALAELSYVAGDHIQRSVKPWDPRDARDYYLGSAVYAWLYLFGEGDQPPPSPFDRHFREACDFYNFSLGLALISERRGTNAVIAFRGGPRRLPVGEVELRIKDTPAASRAGDFEEFLLADQFKVRGLSVRNRKAGLGATLICVGKLNTEFGVRPSSPATIFLRAPKSLAELTTTNASVVSLELYSALDSSTVSVGDVKIPLETDLTAYRAYTLNQASVWKLGPLQFLAPSERIRSQLILNQPYDPGRVPVVFVHGTFSSPVTWAEAANSLTADPVLRSRYQMWSFIYGSGKPLAVSAAELRDALKDMVKKLDPEGKDLALQQMVIIGHSQGGLLTKLTAVKTGDKLWRVFSTKPIEDLGLKPEDEAALRKLMFLEPLPFVRRVVFISTPHRGSYLSGSFVRNLARRFMTLPKNLAARGQDLVHVMQGSESAAFLSGKMPTSLDSMSPRNPALLALAELPILPPIKANSIIAVQGSLSDYLHGRDGLVTYDSAHQSYAESEFIVQSFHSCLDNPQTIEEVRRILHEHLQGLPASLNH